MRKQADSLPVLVYKFYHQTRIEVIPSLTHQSFEREIIDLTKYKENCVLYRVNYSHSLPTVETKMRAESKVAQDLLKQCSDNCYRFVSWVKTGKEMELTAEQLLQNHRENMCYTAQFLHQNFVPWRNSSW